jgi:hypothetical protein
MFTGVDNNVAWVLRKKKRSVTGRMSRDLYNLGGLTRQQSGSRCPDKHEGRIAMRKKDNCHIVSAARLVFFH